MKLTEVECHVTTQTHKSQKKSLTTHILQRQEHGEKRSETIFTTNNKNPRKLARDPRDETGFSPICRQRKKRTDLKMTKHKILIESGTKIVLSPRRLCLFLCFPELRVSLARKKLGTSRRRVVRLA